LRLLGITCHESGHFPDAIHYLHQARQISHESNTPGLDGDILLRLGDAYRDTGQLDTAHHYWKQALDILDDLNDPLATEVRTRLTTTHPENDNKDP
jgi:tetratricopeptide (TPR) repeat protein